MQTQHAVRLDRLHGGENIVAVDAGLAMPLQHMAQLFRRRQLT